MEHLVSEKWMRRAALSSASMPSFVLGGVVVDFGASSFGFHTGLFFFGGVGTAFGIFSFAIYLTFFCSGFFFISLFFFTGLFTIWGWIWTFLRPCGFGLYLIQIMEHCSFLDLNAIFSSLPWILKQISPAPTSIWAPAVLKKGHPRMRVNSLVTSMSSTTKSRGM